MHNIPTCFVIYIQTLEAAVSQQYGYIKRQLMLHLKQLQLTFHRDHFDEIQTKA